MPNLKDLLPFLGPLAELVLDPGVSEIMRNPDGSVWVERGGRQSLTDAQMTEDALLLALKRIARPLSQDIGPHSPILSARLGDGSRVQAVVPPASPAGIALTIRKFKAEWFSLDDLVGLGSMPERIGELLRNAVNNQETILNAGGTGSGKTTLTKALMDCIPLDQRVVVIEDTAELKVSHKNKICMEARVQQTDYEGKVVEREVTIRDLVKASLRLSPARLIIGEVRGAEAFDLLDALNTGHAGSISTLHANSGQQALSRLASMASRADGTIPYESLCMDIGDLIGIVVYQGRKDGVRRVESVHRVDGYDREAKAFRLQSLYQCIAAAALAA